MCTDLVEYLVNRGVAFRSAHEAVSGLVQHARDAEVPLQQLKIADYQKFSDKFDQTVYEQFSPIQSMKAKNSPGATGTAQVKQALAKVRARLKGQNGAGARE